MTNLLYQWFVSNGLFGDYTTKNPLILLSNINGLNVTVVTPRGLGSGDMQHIKITRLVDKDYPNSEYFCTNIL